MINIFLVVRSLHELSLRRGLFSWFSFWIALACYCACIYFMPLRKTLRYGIDLVGGTYITLEVQTDKAVESELLSKLQNVMNKLKETNKEIPTDKIS